MIPTPKKIRGLSPYGAARPDIALMKIITNMWTSGHSD